MGLHYISSLNANPRSEAESFGLNSVRPSRRSDTEEVIEGVIPTCLNGKPPKTKVSEEVGLGKLASSQKALNSEWNLAPYVASLMGLAVISCFFFPLSPVPLCTKKEKRSRPRHHSHLDRLASVSWL